MMNTDVIWLALLAGAAIAIWGAFTYLIPSWLCSMFRYRLWQLRDSLQDDIISGRLPNQDFVHEFVAIIEAAIRMAPKLTLLRIIFTPTNNEMSDVWNKKIRSTSIPAFQKEALRKYRWQFAEIIFMRVLVGSFSGWFVLLLLSPVFIIFLASDAIKKINLSIDRILQRSMNALEKASVWSDPPGKVMACLSKAKNNSPICEFA